MRSNTQAGPPFYSVDYTLAAHFAAKGVPVPTLTATPSAPTSGYIPFPGAKDGQQVLVTPASALDSGLSIAYAIVIPPVVSGGTITTPGCIKIGFNNFTGNSGANLPASDIVLHIEVVPLASE